MPRQYIQGFSNNPLKILLQEYSAFPTREKWVGCLDFHAWGNSSNLFCFFTDVETNEKYRLSVFAQSEYKPRKGDIALDEEPTGSTFEITLKLGLKGKMPQFLNAEKLRMSVEKQNLEAVL